MNQLYVTKQILSHEIRTFIIVTPKGQSDRFWPISQLKIHRFSFNLDEKEALIEEIIPTPIHVVLGD